MPTPRQIKRRRRVAALAIGLVVLGATYLVLTFTLLAPADRDGAEVVHLTAHSRDVESDQGVQVVVPAADIDHTRGRPLLVFLHGHGGSDSTFIEDEAFFRALGSLGRRAPVVAFPDGGEDSYWHDRATGRWGSYVTGEVIPAVVRRFHLDPRRVAIGGISMGGFGAYDIALDHPGRFCAVGGHSPALWLEGGATAPGAFDDAEDFERNDVIGTVRADPGAFGPIPIWNDVGTEDPFLIGSVAFDEALAAGGADLSAHQWHGGHEESYWDRHWKQYLRFYARALESCGK
ncbi:MAG: prolyl oligopeptidase family serine peptidase [Actinobacteria bacterium]|nr:prolyl oligopeptidase family serine peptidase [Actinomycetota bacterium]